jgi:hypothetical protein
MGMDPGNRPVTRAGNRCAHDAARSTLTREHERLRRVWVHPSHRGIHGERELQDRQDHLPLPVRGRRMHESGHCRLRSWVAAPVAMPGRNREVNTAAGGFAGVVANAHCERWHRTPLPSRVKRRDPQRLWARDATPLRTLVSRSSMPSAHVFERSGAIESTAGRSKSRRQATFETNATEARTADRGVGLQQRSQPADPCVASSLAS